MGRRESDPPARSSLTPEISVSTRFYTNILCHLFTAAVTVVLAYGKVPSAWLHSEWISFFFAFILILSNKNKNISSS